MRLTRMSLSRALGDRLPAGEDFASPTHSPSVSARIGRWLGIAFGVCFLTGLLSHGIQHPASWFTWPSRPVSLYRVTQGLHVISGVAAIPLLLAKLWSVYPRLFARPLVRSLPHALERGSVFVLIGAAFFELTTGLFNVAQYYPWKFFFPPAHYAVAWVAIGALLLHIAVKLPLIREGLTRQKVDRTPEFLSRRSFLRTTWLATGVAVVATAGTTVPWLRDVSVLSWRSERGPQGLPVNRTAHAAAVTDRATDPAWRLEIVTAAGTRRLSLEELRNMPQVTVELPIACVEGWSQSASWTGVRVSDLVGGGTVHVDSLERRGGYRSSTLPAEHVSDPFTLLALRLNGEVLDLDHGFPCRVIAPSRPGVLQTKWVSRLEVLR